MVPRYPSNDDCWSKSKNEHVLLDLNSPANDFVLYYRYLVMLELVVNKAEELGSVSPLTPIVELGILCLVCRPTLGFWPSSYQNKATQTDSTLLIWEVSIQEFFTTRSPSQNLEQNRETRWD